MLGAVLVLVGTILMVVGLVFLGSWVGGRTERPGRWSPAVSDGSKTERQLMDLYFITLVIAPLLSGGTLIAFGLQLLLA